MPTSQSARASSKADSFFSATLAEADPEIADAIQLELGRQRDEIELIASENIVSRAVLEAQGSVLTNKYAEGYPGRRYYGGCQYVDVVETLAIERAKKLFGCSFANVQPNSGSQMNQAVFLALLQPGDTFMGLDLAAGGHLTHGSPVNMSGKWFHAVPYGVRKQDCLLDIDEIAGYRSRGKAEAHHRRRHRLFRASGISQGFRRIADEVGAYLMVDMAHFAGLVAGGAHPSPFPHAHVATTTTHKSLRGPRGGHDPLERRGAGQEAQLGRLPRPAGRAADARHRRQGGCLRRGAAARLQGLCEERRGERQGARARRCMKGGCDIVSGGTDNHLMLVDLRPKALTGKAAEAALGRANITCNKNGIPFDPEKPTVTSGIRLGTPAGTTRGFGIAEFQEIGRLIIEVLDGLAANGEDGNEAVEASVRERVKGLTERFPIYQG